MKEFSRLASLCLGVLLVGVIIGGLIGHFFTSKYTVRPDLDRIVSEYDEYTKDQWLEGLTKGDHHWIMNEFDTVNLEDNLRYLAAEPHFGTSERDEELVEFVESKFLESGLDWVGRKPYTLLASLPDPTKPNKIHVLNNGGTRVFTTQHREQFDTPFSETLLDGFSGYTPAGSFQSKRDEAVVYVNYGTVQDFDRLRELGIDVRNRIALIRHGQIYWGHKVQHAEERGMKAVILFSDPEEVAREGQGPEDVYPNSKWMPGTGIQRGGVIKDYGDPSTPGWPSTDYAHRINVADANLVKIPTQPIGYDDARTILQYLGGPIAPSDWQGLLNVTYRLGPGFKVPGYRGHSIRIETHNFEKYLTTDHVIGVMIGSVEPDRYVMIGNHRDGWTYGGADPGTGSTQLLETVRILGKLRNETSWTPRRTLVFISWGSEELSMVSSAEWVEDQVDILQSRAVAYINTDTCAGGPVIEIPSSPLLWDATHNIIAMVPGVSDSQKTVYDELIQFQNDMYPEVEDKPITYSLGARSDYAHFNIYAGITALDLAFRRNRSEYDIPIHPCYHSACDNFHTVSNFIDPGFSITQGCGRVASLTLKYLSDSLIIPFNLTQYALFMENGLADLRESGIAKTIEEFYPNYGILEIVTQNMTTATMEFHNSAASEDLRPDEIRIINDQLRKFEQIFLIPGGLPGRNVVRNAIYSPCKREISMSCSFPGIRDLMDGYEDLIMGADLQARQEDLKRHVSLLTIMVTRAIDFMSDLHTFD